MSSPTLLTPRGMWNTEPSVRRKADKCKDRRG